MPTASPTGAIDPVALPNVTRFPSWDNLVQDLPAILFGFMGIIFMIIFFINGYQYMTSAGNEEQSTKAKKGMISAIVGVAIAAFAYAIIKWFIGRL